MFSTTSDTITKAITRFAIYAYKKKTGTGKFPLRQHNCTQTLTVCAGQTRPNATTISQKSALTNSEVYILSDILPPNQTFWVHPWLSFTSKIVFVFLLFVAHKLLTISGQCYIFHLYEKKYTRQKHRYNREKDKKQSKKTNGHVSVYCVCLCLFVCSFLRWNLTLSTLACLLWHQESKKTSH